MKTKKFLSVLLSVLMLFSLSSVAFAEDEGPKHTYPTADSDFGYCINWIYHEEEKKIEIRGGQIYELNPNYNPVYPWHDFEDEIEELQISYWFLYVYEHAFEGMKHVKKVSLIPGNMDDYKSYYREVNDYSFANMPELETIIIGEGRFSVFSDKAFAGCKNVKTVINKSPDVVVNLDEECKDNVMISCYNDSAQHQACVEHGISHITIDKDKTCGHNSGNPLERIEEFFRNLIDSLRSFFEKLFGR